MLAGVRLVLGIFVVIASALVAPHALADTEECSRTYESAQRFRLQSKLLDARSALVICAQDTCPAALRKDCVAWLAEVNEAMPAVALNVRGSDGCDRPTALT